MKQILLIIASITVLQAKAQEQSARALDLRPYQLRGQKSPFKRNLDFGDYSTTHLRRTLGSFFSFGNFSLANALLQIEGIPLYKNRKSRSKDVFRFELEKNGQTISRTESKAVLRKNETFRLLQKQDSSFFGARNVDFLEAVIQVGDDTSNRWQLAASNLNGTKDEEQKGLIRKGSEEIRFVKTTLVLQDKAVDKDDISSLLASLNLVYSFTYNNQIVGAVSFRETERRFWIREDLDENIRTVIASAASLLTFRRELYY
jgi:hypothetical protein